MFEIEALCLEDIILDMRDRIVTEIGKLEEIRPDINISDQFINEIEGKMEFYVRKINRAGGNNNSVSPYKNNPN